VVVAYFEPLFRHSSGETEESHGTLSQHSQYPGRDSKRVPPEYKLEASLLNQLVQRD
jgi:hypothetical protein